VGRELDAGRNARCKPPGLEVQLRQRVFRPRRCVGIADRGIRDLDPRDIDLEVCSAVFRRRRSLCGRRTGEIVDVELAVLRLHDARAQPPDPHRVHNRLARQQRNQLQRDAHFFHRREFPVARALGQRGLADLRSDAGPEREPDVALELEGALRPLLHGMHHLRLVLIGIKSRGDVGKDRANQNDQTTDYKQGIFDDLHGSIPSV
jgi:hypothetical protein